MGTSPAHEPARPLPADVGADTVASPAISTGVYGYPSEAAAAIAVETVGATPTAVRAVAFVAFNEETVNAYAELL